MGLNEANLFEVTCTFGTFYSESNGEIWNRHIKVPKIAPALLFSISGMNFSVVEVSFKVNINIFLELK